jgi:hypothetical protein
MRPHAILLEPDLIDINTATHEKRNKVILPTVKISLKLTVINSKLPITSNCLTKRQTIFLLVVYLKQTLYRTVTAGLLQPQNVHFCSTHSQ